MKILSPNLGSPSAVQPNTERGMVTVIFIALLAIMMVVLMVESSSIIRLHREVKLLEHHQIKRLAAFSTNAIPTTAKP